MSLPSRLTSTGFLNWRRQHRMNSSARPALFTTVDCASPLTARPDSTYKSGNVVQTSGATSYRMSRTGRRAIALLSSQGSLSVLRGREGRGLPLCPLASAVSPRGVRAVIPLFFWSAQPTIGIHGNSDAVVFSGIGVDCFLTMRGAIPPAYSTWDGTSFINVH